MNANFWYLKNGMESLKNAFLVWGSWKCPFLVLGSWNATICNGGLENAFLGMGVSKMSIFALDIGGNLFCIVAFLYEKGNILAIFVWVGKIVAIFEWGILKLQFLEWGSQKCISCYGGLEKAFFGMMGSRKCNLLVWRLFKMHFWYGGGVLKIRKRGRSI